LSKRSIEANLYLGTISTEVLFLNSIFFTPNNYTQTLKSKGVDLEALLFHSFESRLCRRKTKVAS